MQANIKGIFGEVLREIRTGKGLTQQALADFAGMDRKFISRLENGDKMPSVETLFKLAEHLKIKPKDDAWIRAHSRGYFSTFKNEKLA